MEEETRTDAPTQEASAQEGSAASPSLGVKLLWVAWLAIGLGFDAVRQIGRWLLYGAVIVVPIWLVGRLFGKRNYRRPEAGRRSHQLR